MIRPIASGADVASNFPAPDSPMGRNRFAWFATCRQFVHRSIEPLQLARRVTPMSEAPSRGVLDGTSLGVKQCLRRRTVELTARSESAQRFRLALP